MPNSIQYFLVPNFLTPDPNDQYARVSPRNSMTVEDVVKRCVRRGTTLTETDIAAVVKLFLEEAVNTVAEGNNLNTPLVNLKPSITGIFASKSDTFDASRHTKRASVSMGLGLARAMQDTSAEKIQEPLASPFLLEYTDTNSSTQNTTVTPGGIGMLIGSDLKFDPTNAEEGIFFVPTGAGTDVKVQVLAQRTEGKLTFQIPAAIVAGTYRLEVRRAYLATKVIRTGELSDILTVV